MTGDGKIWRFLETGKGSAMFNMALDTALFASVREGGRPFVRLYGWKRPSITIGHSQRAGDVLDLERCSRDGIEIAVRPTGGRVVFHDDEIAYSIAASTENSVYGGTIAETFLKIGETIRTALSDSGVAAVVSSGRQTRHLSGGMKMPCFASVSRYELTAGGKKIVGSAQRRIGGFFLQQGSILLRPGQYVIAEYIKDAQMLDGLREYLALSATDVKTETGKNLSAEYVINNIKRSFYSALEHDIDDVSIERSECDTAHILIDAIRSEGREEP